jgi:hypothetical protein
MIVSMLVRIGARRVGFGLFHRFRCRAIGSIFVMMNSPGLPDRMSNRTGRPA